MPLKTVINYNNFTCFPQRFNRSRSGRSWYSGRDAWLWRRRWSHGTVTVHLAEGLPKASALLLDGGSPGKALEGAQHLH